MKLLKNNNQEASTMKKLKALLTAEAAVCIALLTYVAAAGEQGAGYRPGTGFRGGAEAAKPHTATGI